MLLINASHPFHRYISLLQWCDVWLWEPLDSNVKTYHDSLSLKLRNMLLLPPILYSFIFLLPLVLDDFDTLNYIFLYISDAVVLSSFNIFSMVLVIVYWFYQYFLNMLLFLLFFWFFDIDIIWLSIIGLCLYSILLTRFVSSTFTVSDVVFRVWCLWVQWFLVYNLCWCFWLFCFHICSIFKSGFFSLIYIGCCCVYWFLWFNVKKCN